MKKKWGRWTSFVARVFCLILLLLVTAVPLALYLGWPPVIGKLAAGRALRQYAAQVHPDWEPEGFWAGYNLVDDGYHLSFADGEAVHSLSCRWPVNMVRDEEREKALAEQFRVDQIIRSRLWQADSRTTYWSAVWPAQAPEQPFISVRTDFYDSADAPVPDEAAMRESMADRAMEAYQALAPATPIHRVSIHYCHQGVELDRHSGLVWNIMTVDLPEGAALTRELILSGELVTK